MKNLRFLAIFLFFYFPLGFFSFQGFSQHTLTRTFAPDSIREEVASLFTELAKKHPGFYRYNPPHTFDAYLDSLVSSIQTPLTELEIYRLLKPAFAKIGCLHTGISLSAETEQALNASPNCLPFDLYFYNQKVYIKEGYTPHPQISPGDEILRINEQDIQDIYTQILPHIPMDGNNTSGKYKILEYTFPIWYRNVIEIETEFIVETRQGGRNQVHVVKGIKADALTTYEEIVDDPLNISFHKETAILRIPSFANSYYQDFKQNFEKEIKSIFEIIRQKNIHKLILDLRGNTGGSDSNAAYLAAHFFGETFRYWDRIEVTEGIAKEVKGASKLFYGKPVQEDGTWLWHGSGISSKEFSFYKPQKPAKFPFEGKVVVLINGTCMSSCADFAAILHHNQKALFVGEETGGGYQGNTSGIIPEETLSSGLVISIPLLKYFNAVDPRTNRGRGTLPDHPVSVSIEEYLAGDDPVLEKALELLHN